MGWGLIKLNALTSKSSSSGSELDPDNNLMHPAGHGGGNGRGSEMLVGEALCSPEAMLWLQHSWPHLKWELSGGYFTWFSPLRKSRVSKN